VLFHVSANLAILGGAEAVMGIVGVYRRLSITNLIEPRELPQSKLSVTRSEFIQPEPRSESSQSLEWPTHPSRSRL
jgi:hypothetical protein